MIDLDAMREAERAKDRMLAQERLTYFIARWSPTDRQDAARFSAELFQIAQTMQREQYELLRPVLENFLNTHNRPFYIPAPKGEPEMKPGSQEWVARVEALRDEEALQPEMVFWISYADGTLPEGQQFLGVVITKCQGVIDASSKTHRLGINPGGEMLSMEIPEQVAAHIPAKYFARLLSREEAEACEAESSEAYQKAVSVQ